MENLIVSKYGGSSITSGQDLERIGNITSDDHRRRVIVVSAPGKRDSDDTKVTDMLIELARTGNENLIDRITERYQQLAPGTDVSHVKDLLSQRFKTRFGERNAFEDSLKSFGEEACARVVASALGYRYTDPKELFRVHGEFGNARIDTESKGMIRRTLLERLGVLSGVPVVVPGFFGYDWEKRVMTFSRGGSDLTGSYLAASLDAEVYENFTDKDGVFSANPEIVPDALKIGVLTFDEMRDLSYSGFSILHQQAIKPVQKARIPIHIRNTRTYPSEGTYVVVDRVSDPKKPVVGIAYRNNFCAFNIDSPGLDDESGVLIDLLQVFRNEGISVEHVPTGIDDVSVIVNQEKLYNTHRIGSVINQLYVIVGEDGRVNFKDNLGCLVVAGKGIRGRRGLAAEIQQELADNQVNINFMSQGAQERCIIYGINGADGDKATRVIHDHYLK